MFGNNLVSLTHPDEVFYTQTAKEMITHGSWMTPYIFDEPQFEKPIFFFWLLAGVVKFFGISPFVARFWPAAFGIGGVLITYWLAFMLFNNKRIAFLSGITLCTSFIYVALSRAVLTDMVFSVLVVLSITLFFYGYKEPKRKSLAIISSFMVSGLAVLTKGVLGFLLPAGVILLFLLYKKDVSFLKNKATGWGALIFLLIAVPWHILMYKLYGQFFIDEYWHNVHVRRIFVAEHQKSNTWYFYLMTMFGGMFPWSLFLIPAVFSAGRKMFRDKKEKEPFVFLGVIILFVWFVMQLAQSKLASYIFPVFPAIAIILGYYFDRVQEDGALTKSMKATCYAMASMLGVGIIVGIYFAHKYIDFVVNVNFVYMIAVLLGICVFFMAQFTRDHKFMKVIASVGSMTLIVLAFLLLGRPYAEPWVSCKDICDVFKKIDNSETTVLCAKFYVRAVRFYTDRKTAVIDINGKGFFSPHPIPFLNTDEKVLGFLNTQEVTYGVLKQSNVKDLERIARGQFTMTHLGDMGGKYIVRIEKLDR